MDVLNLHIHKLCHDVEEIRLRSLNNIINKLDMGIISELQLIEHHQFVQNIIKYFTFKQVPSKHTALNLILRLSKVDRGKALLVRYDPGLVLLEQACRSDKTLTDLFQQILLNCRSFLSNSPRTSLDQDNSSLALPNTSRQEDSVWLVWRTLPHVELVESDAKLVSSLIISLRDTNEYYHSTHFFTSILLRDFLPSIFLHHTNSSVINVLLDVIVHGGKSGLNEREFHSSFNSTVSISCKCLQLLTDALVKQICMSTSIYTSSLYSYSKQYHVTGLELVSSSSSIRSNSICDSSDSSICRPARHHSSKLSTKAEGEGLDLLEYCILVLESVVKSERYNEIELIRSIVRLLRAITRDVNIVWQTSHVHRLTPVLSMLSAASNRSQVLEVLDKLELDIVLYEILNALVPLESSALALDIQLQKYMFQCLLDPVLYLLYPKVHSKFSAYIDKCKYSERSSGVIDRYKAVIKIGKSVLSGAQFFTKHEELPVTQAITMFHDSIQALEYHMNLTIISTFIQLCVTRSSEISEDIEETITNVILQLISSNDSVVITTLRELSKVLGSALGPSNSVKHSVNIKHLLPLVLNHKILIEIASFSLTSKNKERVDISEEILILILKSRRVVSEKTWTNTVLGALIPCFPYIQVFSSKTSILGKLLLSLFDPDNTFLLSSLQILLGNVRLLVMRDNGVRDEAISRLMYLLDISTKPLSLILPHDPITPSTNLTDIYEASSLVRVLDLLLEPDIDSKVIKSALVQISVMTQDILLHDVFAQHNGLNIVHKYLSSTSQDEGIKEFFGPCVTILKNLVRTNGKLRHEYSLKYDIIKNIVTGLFTYDLDWRLQRDISQLLVLLCYSSCIQSSVDKVSFPKVILDNIRDPFPPQSHSHTSLYSLTSYKDELLGDTKYKCYLALQWSLGCHSNNIQSLLSPSGANSTPATNSALLTVPKSALSDLTSCYTYSNISSALDRLATATSHKMAFDSIRALKRYLSLVEVMDNEVNMSHLPWEEGFTRYLATPPASTTDQQLLLDILYLFNTLSDKVMVEVLGCIEWLSRLLREPSPVLIDLLKQTTSDSTTSLKKEVCMEMLRLVERCLKLESETRNLVSLQSWNNLFTLLVDSLNDRHSLQIYCLGITECLVSCIYICCKMKLKCYGFHVVECLYKLLVAFNPSTSGSYMGLSITRQTLLSINLCLPQTTSSLECIRDWDLKLIFDRGIGCSDIIVKSSTLELLSTLCSSSANTSLVVSSSNQLYSTILSYLIDESEVNVVREKAAQLCTNILHHLPNKSYVEESESRGLFRCISIIISRLNETGSLYLSDSNIISLQSSTHNLLSSTSVMSNEYSETSNTDGKVLMPTTLSLLESSICLAINVITVLPGNYVESLRTQGLSPALYRYLCDIGCKDVMLDANNIVLYSKMCKLLCVCPQHSGKMTSKVLHTLSVLLQHHDIKSVDDSLIEALYVEVLRLLSCLLSNNRDIRVHVTSGALSTLVSAIMSHNTQLQTVSLSSMPALASSLNSKASETIVEKLLLLLSKSGNKENISRLVRLGLASVLANSHAGTQAALQHGLAQSLVHKLRETYVTLSVMPPNLPRQNKCNAVLSSLSLDIALISNLMAGNVEGKNLISSLGLCDAVHKLWAWCLLDFSLTSSLLQALITLSASSVQGSLSLVLTSTVVGVGQRKSPTSSSLLHAVLKLLSLQIYPVDVKKKVLELASHACQASECRIVIAKSDLVKDFIKLMNERRTVSNSNMISELEMAYLHFFNVFTYYSESVPIIKNEELFDYLMSCLSGIKEKEREKHLQKLALSIFRNLSFHSEIKQKLLMSDNLLTSLSVKLLDDSLSLEEEKQDIVLFIWSLSANSQKCKQIMRNYEFLDKLLLIQALTPDYTPLHSVLQTTISVLTS